MKKIDYKKEFKDLYNPPMEAAVVNVPKMNFLMIDGKGNPNTSKDYKDSIEALYSLSYILKFMVKKGKTATDYTVMPLEGLWWTDDIAKFSLEDKDIWQWTSMIMQPKLITKELFNEAIKKVKEKKDLDVLSKIRFEDFYEGLSAQIMHIGPYSAEKPTIERLHNFIRENGYEMNGKHHEIYLSDPRKSAPAKMKTIIRQPIR